MELRLIKESTADAPVAFKLGSWTLVAALRSRLSGAAITPYRLAHLAALQSLAILLSGCATTVTGLIQPAHFQFVTTVPHRRPGPGGWRVACVHAQINNGATGEPYTCIFGVEMPIESNNGPISTPLAQRISADCANEAAYAVLSTMTKPPPPPLYTLRTSVRKAFELRLNTAILGSRVKATCDSTAKPVVFGIPEPKP
ncbi:hypothetical protein [Cystobacter ferrugineus]|uniref:hypothetical protein n=1 Tax=Cystobacter ferrugineus TaxID=83449 RepID=UPI00116128BE|nr:hypothetical protein [Cystobacter ferrugineus]